MAKLVTANVFHKRLRPKEHAFRYKVFYMLLPLSHLYESGQGIFSINRFNLLAVHEGDHGPRDGSNIRQWIQKILREHQLDHADGEIWLMCFPRILGYVFNPVSFYFCFDKQERLRAVLAEVNNTFGETHSYLIYHPDQRPIGPDDWFEAEKYFHVSPFLDVVGTYRFRFALPHDKKDTCTLSVWIDYHDKEDRMLLTCINGQTRQATKGVLLWVWSRHPLLAVKIISMIHWQALKLWLAKAGFRRKPMPPNRPITIARPSARP